jgi:hypothetical protein
MTISQGSGPEAAGPEAVGSQGSGSQAAGPQIPGAAAGGRKLPAVSEYALIVGAGAAAAAGIAAQQVAVATLPVTTLVALGLLNRYRLDQRLQASEPQGPITTAPTARSTPAAPGRVTAQPQPEAMSSRTHPLSPQPAVRVSPTPSQVHPALARQLQAKTDFEARQRASLRELGAHLRQVREDKALSLEAVYQQTFIQPYNLRAIENGDLKQLPEPFYIRAFIQKYASVLGLEGATLAAGFPMA